MILIGHLILWLLARTVAQKQQKFSNTNEVCSVSRLVQEMRHYTVWDWMCIYFFICLVCSQSGEDVTDNVAGQWGVSWWGVYGVGQMDGCGFTEALSPKRLWEEVRGCSHPVRSRPLPSTYPHLSGSPPSWGDHHTSWRHPREGAHAHCGLFR